MANAPEMDERWFQEYVEFGWADLLAYLTKWARFLQLYPETGEDASEDTK